MKRIGRIAPCERERQRRNFKKELKDKLDSGLTFVRGRIRSIRCFRLNPNRLLLFLTFSTLTS